MTIKKPTPKNNTGIKKPARNRPSAAEQLLEETAEVEKDSITFFAPSELKLDFQYLCKKNKSDMTKELVQFMQKYVETNK